MDLQEGLLSVLVEGGAATDVYGATPPAAVRQRAPSRVNSVGRPGHGLGNGHVGGGEPDRHPSPVTGNHGAAHFVAATQHGRGPSHVAAGEGPAHDSRRHRLAGVAAVAYELEGNHLEAPLAA